MARLLSHGVLDQNGNRKNNLRVVRIGQTSDLKSDRDSDVQEVSLDNLVEKRRLSTLLYKIIVH